MASVLDSVQHYQHTIEKYPSDEHKVLKCIDKLYNLPVTVQHLQETGVGRTVNALRKDAGEVGQAARALVYKWKLMVAAEESDQETDQNNDSSTHNGHGSGKDSDDNAQCKTKSERSHSSSKPKDHQEINGNYSGSKKRYHSSEDEEPPRKRSKHYSSSEDDYKRKSHSRVKRPDTESESDDSQSNESDSKESESSQEEVKVKQEIKKEHSSHKPSSSKHSSHNEHAVHKSSSSRPHHSLNHHRHSSPIKESHSSDTSSSKEKSHRSDKHKHSKEKESTTEKKHKSDAEKSHKDSKSSSKHSLEKQSSSEKHKCSDKHSSSEKHGSSDKHRSSSSHKSDSGSDKNKTSSDKHSKSDKHKSSSHLHGSEKEKHKSSSEKESEKSKHKVKDSTSNSSSSKEKHSSSSKDKSRHSSSSKEKSSSHSSEKKHSSSGDNKSNSSSSKGHSEKNDEKSDKKSKHRSSSSSLKSSNSSTSKIETVAVPKKKVQIQNSDDHDTDDGIDCGSGASFAEALGMITPAKSKKKLLKDVSSPNNDYSAAALLAPTTKLAPLPTLEILSLPEISPNYKPRPPPRPLPHFNDEDAMSCVLSSKNQRTKVYSGNKVIGGKIPSLYEMCVNVLQEHIDALEYTGGVPYEILKPVVDRATPQQLFILEHYNPYLMEDTDHLWQKFCQKHFRSKQRQENETWREMFSRCQEEQEIRLKSLTNNIRIAQEAKKAPIKQTKMAYVDSIAKPPRNIAKKQAQHGTARLATGSPAARVAALASGPNVLRGGAAARALAPLPSSGGSSFKPKKAPLMAKALQIMRGRKR